MAIFIFEAFNKLVNIFRLHPLQSSQSFFQDFCMVLAEKLQTSPILPTFSVDENKTILLNGSVPMDAWTVAYGENTTAQYTQKVENEPNTAMLSAFLMLATFIIAYYLKLFRNGEFLPRLVSVEILFLEHCQLSI